MKILLDECLPKKLKAGLNQYEIFTVYEMGWSGLKDGKLIKVAIDKEFDVLVTIDKNLKYQQNINSYNITIVVLDVLKSKIEYINPLIPKFIKQAPNFKKGEVYLIS